jgi:5-methylcytosine-specific restriction protein A
MRNPNWSRDELILALDLYIRAGRKQLPSHDPQIIELSQTLNRLPLHSGRPRGSDFRNPNGASMKLANFLSVDPQYSGTGLGRGNRMEQEVWDEFADDLYKLRRTALAIRNTAARRVAEPRSGYVEDDDEEFPEGRILTRLHKQKERSSRAVERKKESVLNSTGALRCEACGFDFHLNYGDLGRGYAECHHRVPLADLTEERPIRLVDLAIVCANCHRILHKSRPLMSVEELCALVELNRAARNE